MTRVIFFPDEQEIIRLDDARSVEELLAAITAGDWQPPEPYRESMQGRAFRGVEFQGWVIAAPEQPEPAGDLLDGLSERQMTVLQALADGLGDKEIAVRIHISRSMIAKHVTRLHRRLGTQTRSQLVSRAAALGLVKMKRKEKKP